MRFMDYTMHESCSRKKEAKNEQKKGKRELRFHANFAFLLHRFNEIDNRFFHFEMPVELVIQIPSFWYMYDWSHNRCKTISMKNMQSIKLLMIYYNANVCAILSFLVDDSSMIFGHFAN